MIFPFEFVLDKTCQASDYTMWSAANKDGCLMGHITKYQRRMRNALCFNGQDFVRHTEVKNCLCSREDFEW